MSSVCPNCENSIESSAKTLQCDRCSAAIHSLCVDLPADKVQIFTRSKSKGFRFFCKKCISQQDAAASIDIPALLADLRNSIGSIQKRLEALELKLVSPEPKPDFSFEDAVNEALDRIQKSKNVIVFGVAENSDLQVVSSILKTINSEVNIAHNPIRIGKPGQRPRPVRVTLSSSEEVVSVLKNKNKLAGGQYSSVKIKSDETFHQRQHLRDLRVALQTRIDAGETNITIKYIRGVPKIVPVDKPNENNTPEINRKNL